MHEVVQRDCEFETIGAILLMYILGTQAPLLPGHSALDAALQLWPINMANQRTVAIHPCFMIRAL